MGVVVERMPKAYERADAVVDAGHAAMRNRHAVTQAGTAELFACREAAKDIAGIEVAGACQQLRQLLKRLLLARSEEHTSELQSLMRISYAVFCLKKKKIKRTQNKSRDTNIIRRPRN